MRTDVDEGPSRAQALPADLGALWSVVAESSMVGLAVLDADGVVVVANRALRELVGRDAVGGFTALAHPGSADEVRALAAVCAAGGPERHCATVRFDRPDGSSRWGQACATRAGTGAASYVVVEVVDVTAQQDDQDRLAEAVAHLEHQRGMSQAILDTVDIGLVLIDSTGRYERMNRRHADFMELAFPQGHRGQAGQLGSVFGADGVTRLGRAVMPSLRSQRGEEFDDYRIWVGEDPVTRRALSVSGRSVLDEHGHFAGAALAYTDVTEATYADRSRTDFIATVSHELRTPLASMLGHLEMLLDDDGGDELAAADHERVEPGVTASLRAVHRNAVRLRLLVSDLIESAQQQRGAFHLERATYDVALLVRDAVAATAPIARRAGIEMVVDAREPAWALVDPHRLRQVVDNLLSNAVKYTPGGGRITLTARRDEVHAQLVVVVADTGAGIAADDLEQVFLPYFRAESARASQVPGVGLGLGVVRSIVLAHGGDVDVASVLGGGSTFVVRVPLGT